jgi:hypothetical protein
LDCIGVVVAKRNRVRAGFLLIGRLTYDVTGMSPQSRTVAQLLNGLASSGTL